MTKRFGSVKIGTLLSVTTGILFVVVGAIVIALVNYNMRNQALVEAKAKMRLMLDRNMAVHTYFSQIMKPNLFEVTEPLLSSDYFDPSWMSSSYAVREMNKYFDSFSLADYSYKDAAINARSPENEADAEERAFIAELRTNPSLKERSGVSTIDGKPYLVVLRPGEVMEESCLRCHGNPKDAPGDLVHIYGPERSFHREAELGQVVSAVSVRVPLAVAHAGTNRFSLQLSVLLLALMGLLSAVQYFLPRRLVFAPLTKIRDMALQISTREAHLGEQIPAPFGEELATLAHAFNTMSLNLHESWDHMEARIQERTADLKLSEEALRRERDFAEGLIETAQTIVLVLDTQGRIVRFNPYMEEISGYALADVQGKDWFTTFLPERDRERVRRIFMNAICDIQTRGNVNPIVTKDGREREIEWYDKTLKDAQGNTTSLLAIGRDITEQKRAENAQRENEERFHALIERSHDAITLVAADGTVLYDSPSIARVLGYNTTERIGRKVFEFVPPEEREGMAHSFAKFAQEMGAVAPSELRFIHKDGTLRFIEGVRTNLLQEPAVRAVVVNYRDITERKQAEEELRTSEEKLRILFEQLPIGVSLLDQNRMIIYANPALEKILDLSKDDLLQGQYQNRRYIRPDGTPMPPEEFASVRAFNEQRLVHDVETGVITENGKTIWTSVSAAPFPVADQGVVITTIDITDRKQAEEALRASEDRYRNLFETAPDSIFIVDRTTGNFVAANLAASQRYGYSNEEFLHLKARDVSAESEKTVAAIRDGITQVPLRLHRRKDGTIFPVEITGSYYTEGGRNLHTAFIRDITKRKQVEAALEQSHERLRALTMHLQTSIEAERTHIAREIHDELGQTLTALKMDLTWLAKRLPEDGEKLDRIHGMTALVNESIALMRRIATDLRPGMLDDLGLAAALEWQTAGFSERTGIVCELSLPPDDLNLDPVLNTNLFRIFQETLTNVARHAQATRVNASLQQEGNTLILTVHDDGRGITKSEIKDQRSLGLLGLRERAAQWGGDLTIRGEAGEGTTITVRIPLPASPVNGGNR